MLKQVLIIIGALFLFFFVIGLLIGDVKEGYTNSSSGNSSGNCVNNLSHESQMPAMNMSAIQNSVSSGLPYNCSNGENDEKPRVFKYPHYYGLGVPNSFAYGEPYYLRND